MGRTSADMLDLIKQSQGFHPTPKVVTDTIARWLGHLRRQLETVIVPAPLSECDVAGGPIRVRARISYSITARMQDPADAE